MLNTILEKLMNGFNYVTSKIVVVFDYLVSSITNPLKMILTSFAIGLSVDALMIGKIGFIAFVFANAQTFIAMVSAGGWQLVVIILIVALVLSKK